MLRKLAQQEGLETRSGLKADKLRAALELPDESIQQWNTTQALIADMKKRGLLDHTLVVWATEFGRMPFLQANGTGRDHNPDAFTCFLTGAGVKRGFSYGESDAFGFIQKTAMSERTRMRDVADRILDGSLRPPSH